jgi:outer membrane protein assembly factor BamB
MTQAAEQMHTHGEGSGCRAARTTAVVGAVFSAIFTLLLVWNLIGSGLIGPWREEKLAAMKLQFQKEPTNQELLADIRRLDLKIRRDRLWRLDFAHRATFMLLGSAVLLLVAGRIAGHLSREPPRPVQREDVGQRQIREARQARWAVMGGLVMLALGGLLVGASRWVAFVQAEDAGSPYASMEEKASQWPRFRGAGGAGVSLYTDVPTQWDAATGEGVLWKTTVPLPGWNSPVVWKDRVFLSGADPNVRRVYCFDAADGRLLWTGEVPTTPLPNSEKLELEEDTGYAASTVATDGRRVYAIFPTGDVAGFDFRGRRLWHRALGRPDNAYGYASSLDTFEKLVLIQYDQGDGSEGKSRMIALDGLTGQIVWETKRDTPNSWSSPIVVDVAGQPQLITVADPCVVAYDPADGAELWRAKCVGGDMAPSPIYAGGLVFAIEPYSKLAAVKPTGRGDVTESGIAWRMEEGGPDICSPVSDGRYVYLLDSGGLLLCCRAETGEKVYETDLKEEFQASPSLAGDRLYLLDVKGAMHIAQAGAEYREIGKCELGEKCIASPAFSPGRIYIRGAQHLFCIGNTAAEPVK